MRLLMRWNIVSVARSSMCPRLLSDSTHKKFVFSSLLLTTRSSVSATTYIPSVLYWMCSRFHSISTLLSPRLSVGAVLGASRGSVLRLPTRVARRRRRNKRLHLTPCSPACPTAIGIQFMERRNAMRVRLYAKRNAIMFFHATRRVWCNI